MPKVAESPIISEPNWFKMDDPTKLTNSFEFGPAWWIHLPMKIFGIYWSVKLLNLGFFQAANPGLENGGLFDYSKNESLNKFRQINIPKTFVLDFPYNLSDIPSILDEAAIEFPFIIKPDFGERGREVELISDIKSMTRYFANKIEGKYLIQEYLADGMEFGVFYIKNPKTGRVCLTSLTLKLPLQILGDGKSTIRNLALSHARVSKYIDEITYPNLDEIPDKNHLVKLSIKGNHCKGAIFLDCSEYIDETMIAAFKRICTPFKDFFYGRLDVKVRFLEDLKQEQKIKILEVNGCNSEPIHIYSPEKTYLMALKIIKDHVTMMADIAKYNLVTNKYQTKFFYLYSNYLNFRKSRKL